MTSTITEQQAAHWIRWIQQDYPDLVKSMRQSNHHYDELNLNAFHLEGDVWTHTMMVLQSYVIDGINDTHVGLTALLHDIGKPSAMYAIHERKRRVFKGHESLSAWKSWALLQSPRLNLSLNQRLRIFSLIALHGCLYQNWFTHKDTLITQIAQAFSGFGLAFWQQLMQQITHDMRGQVSDGKGHKSDLLALSQPVSEAIQAFSVAKRKYSSGPSCSLLIGVPGCGKSSYCAQQAINSRIISRDNLLHTITCKSASKFDQVSALKFDHSRT